MPHAARAFRTYRASKWIAFGQPPDSLGSTQRFIGERRHASCDRPIATHIAAIVVEPRPTLSLAAMHLQSLRRV
jgi:hypothetical protein